MKKIIAVFFTMFAFTGTAIAQSDASLTWSISGVADIAQITMDAEFTSRYIAVNGVVTNTRNISVPVTGTCFGTTTGGAYCTFFIAGGRLIELTLQSSLNGTIRALDSNLIVTDSGTVTLTDLR